MRTLDELRQALGLSAADSLVEEARIDAPATGVGRGLSLAPAEAGLSEQTIQAIRAQPNFSLDAELNRHLGTTSAARWEHDERFITLGDAAVVWSVGAVGDIPEHGWVIDTRGSDSAIVVEDRSTNVARYLSALNGAVHVGRIERATPTKPMVFREPPSLELPNLEGILEGVGTKRWLRTEIERRAESASALSRTAAVGLTLRLAMSELDEPERLFNVVVSGGVDPVDVVRTWARSLGHEVVSYVEAAALDEAARLGDEIEQLAGLVIRDRSDAARLAVWLRQRRDDLESVCTVLRQAMPDSVVVDALASLDRRASSQLSAFDMVADADSDPLLLGAVASNQPGAWWGTAWPD